MLRQLFRLCVLATALTCACSALPHNEPKPDMPPFDTTRGDRMLAELLPA